MPFTVDSLSEQVRGELEMNPDAAGGSVPARMEAIAKECGRYVWKFHDWRFRWKPGVLTTVEGTATAVLPDDFAELAQKWVVQNTSNPSTRCPINFVEDPVLWQQEANLYDATDVNDRSQPYMATVVQDLADTSNFTWLAKLTPTPDAIYTYDYWYLTLDPWTLGDITGVPFANTKTPQWPDLFHEGWHTRMLYRCQQAFHKPSGVAWERTRTDFERWLAAQQKDNDETMTLQQDRTVDAYNDFQHTAQAGFDGASYDLSRTGIFP